jgi:CBS domain-containing protein
MSKVLHAFDHHLPEEDHTRFMTFAIPYPKLIGLNFPQTRIIEPISVLYCKGWQFMLSVNDLMTVDPRTIRPDTSLHRIIQIMKSEGCRQLPVVDEGVLVGIVTDRDVRQMANSPLSTQGSHNEEMLEQTSAESCMTIDPITVTPETSAARAAEMLSIYKFGALPVVADHTEHNKTIVGILSVTDILNYFVAQNQV